MTSPVFKALLTLYEYLFRKHVRHNRSRIWVTTTRQPLKHWAGQDRTGQDRQDRTGHDMITSNDMTFQFALGQNQLFFKWADEQTTIATRHDARGLGATGAYWSGLG